MRISINARRDDHGNQHHQKDVPSGSRHAVCCSPVDGGIAEIGEHRTDEERRQDRPQPVQQQPRTRAPPRPPTDNAADRDDASAARPRGLAIPDRGIAQASGWWQSFPVKSSNTRAPSRLVNSLTVPRVGAPTQSDPPMPPPGPPLSYREAGVDIDAGDQLVENIKPYAQAHAAPGSARRHRRLRRADRAAASAIASRCWSPGTDGVGTKLKLAFALGKHDTIGIDLVAMSVNDILVQGAEPLFFLDYYVCERARRRRCNRSRQRHRPRLRTGRMRADRRRNRRASAGIHSRRVRPRRIRRRRGREIESHRRHHDRGGRRPHRPAFERPAFERILADPQHRRHRRAPTCSVRLTASQRDAGPALLEPTRIYVKPVLALMSGNRRSRAWRTSPAAA